MMVHNTIFLLFARFVQQEDFGWGCEECPTFAESGTDQSTWGLNSSYSKHSLTASIARGSVGLRHLGEAQSGVNRQPIPIHQGFENSPHGSQHDTGEDISWIVCTNVDPRKTDHQGHCKQGEDATISNWKPWISKVISGITLRAQKRKATGSVLVDQKGPRTVRHALQWAAKE